MPMTESLFSAMRIVAMILAADGHVDEREEKWFLLCMRSYPLTHEQREILRAHLKGEGNIEELHGRVTGEKDRERLMNWVRVAISRDGKIDPAERQLLEHIQALNRLRSSVPRTEYEELAGSLLQADKDVQLWKDLGEAGRYFGKRLLPFHHYHFADLILLRGFSLRNRFIFWGLVIFFAGSVLAKCTATWLSRR